MGQRSKRYRAVAEHIDRSKRFNLAEAIELAKKTSNVKFDASLELHFHLGIDASKADQAVRGTVKLPHGTGKQLTIAVFASGTAAQEAQTAGADTVGAEDLIKEIKERKITDFDIAVATPDMMKKLAPIAKILGQRGLMPNPKNQTISPNPGAIVQELKAGKVAFRSDETGNIHQIIGKASFDSKKLQDNAQALIETVRRAKPAEVKGTFILSISLASSMGPAIKIDPAS